MRLNSEIEKRVEEALSLAEKINFVEPRPFFYTRVAARLETQRQPALSLIPSALKIACALLLILNSVYFLSFKSTTQENSTSNFASYYQLSANDFYNQ
jgi:hypothetical protein